MTQETSGVAIDPTDSAELRWTTSDYALEFTVKPFTRQPDGSVLFWGDRYSESWEHAEEYVSGFVKWDGCADWDFGTRKHSGIHTCGASGIDIMIWSIMTAWRLAQEKIPNAHRGMFGTLRFAPEIF